MAATVAQRTEYALTTAGTTSTPTFTQTTGDLVVIFLSLAVAGTITPGDGFTNLTNINANFHIIYKVLDGSEGGNVAITTPSSKSCAIAYNIQGALGAPQHSTVATGTSTGPDPSTVTPSGGSMSYLWLAAFYMAGEEADDDTWCNSAPGTPVFTNLTQKTTGTGGLPATNSCIASAEYSSTASSMDPTAFNTDQSLAWRAYTVAISPASPQVASPGTGVGTFAGFAPTASATDNKVVTPGTGVASFTGFSPTVVATENKNILSGFGEASFAGFAPTIEIGSDIDVTPGYGQLVFTGFAPVVTATDNKNIETGLGQMSFVGFSPTVQTPVNVTTNTGQLSFTGFSPIVSTSDAIEVTPGTGEGLFTGFNPTVQTPVNIRPGTGLLIITGFAPVVETPSQVDVYPLTGEAIFTGFEPSVSVLTPPQPRQSVTTTGGGAATFDMEAITKRRRQLAKDDEEILIFVKAFLTQYGAD